KGDEENIECCHVKDLWPKHAPDEEVVAVDEADCGRHGSSRGKKTQTEGTEATLKAIRHIPLQPSSLLNSSRKEAVEEGELPEDGPCKSVGRCEEKEDGVGVAGESNVTGRQIDRMKFIGVSLGTGECTGY
ncbi:unnamed protein product, partial [Dibothriocephalus latus]